MSRISTRNQLILLGALIVASIIGGTCLIISMQRQAAIGAFQTAANNLSNGMSQQTAHFVMQTDQVLRTVGSRVVASPDLDLAAIEARMQSPSVFGLLWQQQSRVPDVDALILVGADGKVANNARSWPAASADVSSQDYFRHFKVDDDPGLFIGIPMQDPASGDWTVPLARRIDAAHGAFAGIVVAQLSLTDLAAFYQLAMPAGRTVYLARRDGVVLLRYPARPTESGRRIPVTSPWYAIVASGGGVYNGPSYFSPAPVVAAVQPLTNLPLVIEASCLQQDALLKWEQGRYWVVLGGIVSALFAIGVLQLFGLQFKRIETSERKLAAKNAELDLARLQMEATLANLSQGVCFFDENNNLLVFNQRFCQMIGLPGETVRIGMSTAEIAEMRIAAGTFWDTTLAEYLATLDARLREGVPVDEISELLDGRTVSKHFEPLAGGGWVMTLEDISERRAAERQIAYLAHHDMLTGLANRALFRDHLRHAFTDAASSKGFALLCLDLDRFKAVNDTYGHPVGDGLLFAVADRLRAAVRGGDLVARLGGDEFVILQLNVSEQSETTALAHRVVEAIGQPFMIEGHRLSIGVSIGIAMAPRHRMNPERLFKDADLALYRSKQAGRGTWKIFDAAMEVKEQDRNAVTDELLDRLSQGGG
jgi:diguanylate cyclase (GGDEF)-like protein